MDSCSMEKKTYGRIGPVKSHQNDHNDHVLFLVNIQIEDIEKVMEWLSDGTNPFV